MTEPARQGGPVDTMRDMSGAPEPAQPEPAQPMPSVPAEVACDVRTEPGGTAGTPIWLRTVAGWHIAFWAVLAAATVAVLVDDLSAGRRWTYAGLLAVLGAAYVLWGQPAASSRSRARSHAYRIVLVVVLGAVAATYPGGLLLLYVAFPQVWFLSEGVREGALFSALLSVSVTLGVITSGGWSWATLAGAAPWLIVSLGVSLALGLWISKVVDQSEERARLITELQTTRDRLAAAHHASGVVAERERMAREIHDTLAQGFTSVIMLAETASTHLARDRPDLAADQLELIESTARDNLAEARALVAAFSPVALAAGTLPEAVRRLAARFSVETGVVAVVHLQPDDDSVARLHAGQQVVLLRAAQEALTNVRRHAAARRVNVVLRVAPDGTSVIEVSDDGVGFQPSAVPATGFGLAGMRHRVEQAGGTVSVRSEPGNGTDVHVLLPAPAQAGGS